MSENINITLSHDEALVLFEFFSRFCDDHDDFTLRHTAEYLAFMKMSAQLDKALVEPFQSYSSCYVQRETASLRDLRAEHQEFTMRWPNTSVEPTAYAVSIRIVMDSLFTLMSFHSSAHRLWLTSIR